MQGCSYVSDREYFAHGHAHPDPVVETTSLAFVRPPAFGDEPVLPGILQTSVARRTLSSLQLEAVAYALERHRQTLEGDA